MRFYDWASTILIGIGTATNSKDPEQKTNIRLFQLFIVVMPIMIAFGF